MTLAHLKIGDVEMGEVEIGTIEFDNGMDDEIETYAVPLLNVNTQEAVIHNIKIYKRTFMKLMQQMAPDSPQAKGYYIVNKRGRNKLKELFT